MFTLRIFDPTPGLYPAPDRKRSETRVQLALEALEGRALLSHIHAAAHGKPVAAANQAAEVGLFAGVPIRPNPHPGPIVQEIGTGFVVKSPRFYPAFTGPKRGELNAAGAKAFLDGQGNAVLVGIVAGTIDPAPKTADKSEFYAFYVNRGLTGGPGPFPGRPAITFDAVVFVAITPDGISGYVRDLATGAQTPLTADQIVIPSDRLHTADSVRVTFPSGLLIPPGTTPTTVPTIVFSPLAAPLPGNYTDVTSFAPEFRGFPLSLGPIPHHGR